MMSYLYFFGLAIVLLGVYYYFQLRNHWPAMNGMFPWLEFGKKRGYSFEQMPDLSGKVAIVTGANSGIGKSTAKLLALKNAHVIAACRNTKKGEVAVNEIRAAVAAAGATGTVELVRLDLASLQSVENFAKTIRTLKKPVVKLDMLIANAGVGFLPFRLSADGYEMHWAVNHLGHAHLISLLEDLLEAPSSATVTIVTSGTAYHEKRIFTSAEEINSKAHFTNHGAYARSKLANMMYGRDLARRLRSKNIFVNVVRPGGVRTQVMDSVFSNMGIPAIGDAAFEFAFKIGFAWHPDVAAITLLYSASSPEIINQDKYGKLFVPVAREYDGFHEFSDNESNLIALRNLTEEMVRKAQVKFKR